jgi:hypothetical protein
MGVSSVLYSLASEARAHSALSIAITKPSLRKHQQAGNAQIFFLAYRGGVDNDF